MRSTELGVRTSAVDMLGDSGLPANLSEPRSQHRNTDETVWSNVVVPDLEASELTGEIFEVLLPGLRNQNCLRWGPGIAFLLNCQVISTMRGQVWGSDGHSRLDIHVCQKILSTSPYFLSPPPVPSCIFVNHHPE